MKIFLIAISLSFSIYNNIMAQNASVDKNKITLVIHGGAGTITRAALTPAKEAAYKEKLCEALNSGFEVLVRGGSSTEAVITAITILEDSPLFNAGKGAVFTSEGKNELDASIMEGKSHKAGAVAGVTTIKNPIKAAFAVMEKSPHVMMAGKGAEDFARAQGVEIVSPDWFYSEERFRQLQKIRDSDSIKLDHSIEDKGKGQIPNSNDEKFGTVGAVALDQFGNLAAGTSTGGMTNKKYGRIGDSPIIGAGTYADNGSCAVSATGHGEFFIREVVAYDIAALMKYNQMTVSQAAEKVVLEKLAKINAEGGVIALDASGNLSMPFNTAGMYRGYIRTKGSPHVFIFKD